jgi:hypothetical protein
VPAVPLHNTIFPGSSKRQICRSGAELELRDLAFPAWSAAAISEATALRLRSGRVSSFPMERFESLGRRLIQEMRLPLPTDEVETASDVLRWDGDQLDAEEVWAAALAALEECSDEGEYWALGDGFVAEQVHMRPVLAARWLALESSNAKAAEIRRVMEDPTWNWGLNEDK